MVAVFMDAISESESKAPWSEKHGVIFTRLRRASAWDEGSEGGFGDLVVWAIRESRRASGENELDVSM